MFETQPSLSARHGHSHGTVFPAQVRSLRAAGGRQDECQRETTHNQQHPTDTCSETGNGRLTAHALTCPVRYLAHEFC